MAIKNVKAKTGPNQAKEEKPASAAKRAQAKKPQAKKPLSAKPAKAPAARKIKTVKAKKETAPAALKKRVGLLKKPRVSEEPARINIVKPAVTPEPAAPAVKPQAIKAGPEPVAKPRIAPPAPAKLEAPAARLPQAHLELAKKPQPEIVPAAPKKEEPKTIEIDIPIMLKDLALGIQEKPAFLIKRLLEQKIIANLNFSLDEELARKIASDYGYQIKRKPTEEEVLFKEHEFVDAGKLKPRPPIVTLMGHVDHGKTSLLDAIRNSKVADSEHGGITQHIGAYSVVLPKGTITFLDTPGHEAFTAMRARGAKATDIVVLVVAADDGIMPQTIEAVDHAREAGVPIVVAINKIDKPNINLDLVKKQLSELGLTPEDWGGKTITVGVSAKTGQGIDDLLDMLILEAEMLELKADPSRLASGVVLEAKITEGRGTVATLLVENGTLRMQNAIIVGPYFAKVRAMLNEFGRTIADAPPSTPVAILGLPGLPSSGEKFFALTDEKKAKEVAEKRKMELREKELKPIKMMSLEDLSTQIKEGKVKELKLILKADVAGSLEAINESLKKLAVTEVRLNIIHQGVGAINVSDIILSEASGAIILGFHVDTDERSKAESDKAGVDIRTYNVIYELINDLKTALEGLLEPKLKKIFLGRLMVRQVFKLTKSGMVAGCYVEKGKVTRSAKVTLMRNGEPVFEGALQSLKRFKDDVREVTEGMECGVSLANSADMMVGDVLEAYDIEKIARKL
jgi:translation initiation factor IF-2